MEGWNIASSLGSVVAALIAAVALAITIVATLDVAGPALKAAELAKISEGALKKQLEWEANRAASEWAVRRIKPYPLIPQAFLFVLVMIAFGLGLGSTPASSSATVVGWVGTGLLLVWEFIALLRRNLLRKKLFNEPRPEVDEN